MMSYMNLFICTSSHIYKGVFWPEEKKTAFIIANEEEKELLKFIFVCFHLMIRNIPNTILPETHIIELDSIFLPFFPWMQSCHPYIQYYNQYYYH